MAEYIERKAAVSELNRIEKLYQNNYISNVRAEMVSYCCQVIKHIPAADVVEVVRCRECKWFGLAGCAIQIVDDTDKPSEDDFCSFGERKGGDE